MHHLRDKRNRFSRPAMAAVLMISAAGVLPCEAASGEAGSFGPDASVEK